MPLLCIQWSKDWSYAILKHITCSVRKLQGKQMQPIPLDANTKGRMLQDLNQTQMLTSLHKDFVVCAARLVNNK